ncbi:hypothetical protein [Actinoplanes sp. ATCC 53533]|uniref:hypothetical protein n=1 Tax=Actinoplanes sp. ATCC 53533 TaxID=1288362 RepID=UPI000F7A97DF|nr:hypothetical protein [Actinoplanes sp. ATCC 53533]
MITGEIHEPLPRGSFVAGWSLRRRWALAACLMVGFLCCGLGAVPVAAFLDHTDSQGDPPATAVEAVDIYLNQLLLKERIGLTHALITSERDDLVKQWESLIKDMQRTDPPPDKLEWGPHFDVEDQGDEVTRVTVPVRAVWWQERGMSMQGTEHPWVFVARAEDGGWRIAEVRPHPWCGGHVRADACR